MLKSYPYIGIVGALVAYIFIFISESLAPWFSWYNNALSDLGNTATHGSTALYFNPGLLTSGFLIFLFSVFFMIENKSWKYLIWAIPLSFASIDLMFIGIFNESFGGIHLVVSVIFFLLIAVSLLIYSYVSFPLGTPKLGAVALVMGILSAIVWLAKWPWPGVAIQEFATSMMASIFVLMICGRLLKEKPRV